MSHSSSHNNPSSRIQCRNNCLWHTTLVNNFVHHIFALLGLSWSKYCHNVWDGKTRIVGLPDGEKVSEYIYSFWCNTRMWQTDIAWWHRPCYASCSKNLLISRYLLSPILLISLLALVIFAPFFNNRISLLKKSPLDKTCYIIVAIWITFSFSVNKKKTKKQTNALRPQSERTRCLCSTTYSCLALLNGVFAVRCYA